MKSAPGKKQRIFSTAGRNHPALSENARQILRQRYLLRNNRQEIIETPAELFLRIARVVAAAEKAFRKKKQSATKCPPLLARIIMLDLTKNWKRVIDALPSGIIVIGTGGTIRHVNPALERLTGYRADELIGSSCAMLDCSGCEPWYGQGGFWCMLFSSEQAMEPMICQINSKSGYPLKVIKQASIFHDAQGVAVGAVETIWDMANLRESIPGNCCSEIFQTANR